MSVRSPAFRQTLTGPVASIRRRTRDGRAGCAGGGGVAAGRSVVVVAGGGGVVAGVCGSVVAGAQQVQGEDEPGDDHGDEEPRRQDRLLAAALTARRGGVDRLQLDLAEALVAQLVLVDEQLGVEVERLGVRAQEALDVRRTRAAGPIPRSRARADTSRESSSATRSPRCRPSRASALRAAILRCPASVATHRPEATRGPARARWDRIEPPGPSPASRRRCRRARAGWR